MLLPYETGSITLTSPFGERNIGNLSEFHYGIDLVGQASRRLIAVEDGIIGVSTLIANPSNRTAEWGNYVRLDTSSGLHIYYCHLSRRLVDAGTVVRAGDHIGIEGSTGKSSGSHLHFEVRDLRGNRLNAAEYLGIENAVGEIYQPDFGREVMRLCGLGHSFGAHVNLYPYADAAWRKIYTAIVAEKG